MKKILLTITLTIISSCLSASLAYAKEPRDPNQISDWYIQNFQQKIIVNTDSTMEVTEDITADCGTLPNKHGIFRVLPTTYDYGNGKVKTPPELISITDFSGKKIKFSETKTKKTITWKIGDPDKTVTGVNYYRIKYKYKNVIRNQAGFDEFYWNLNGNFWEIFIDNFESEITFPTKINQLNTKTELYTGTFGSKRNSLATLIWTGQSTLNIKTDDTLLKQEGVTLSVSLPANIFTPYKLTRQDERLYMDLPLYWKTYYPAVYWTINLLGIPLVVITLICAIKFWRKYGKDPKGNDTLTPEFEIPEKLTPFEMGLIYSNDIVKKGYFAGALINLAVKKVIKIEELKGNIIFGKDYVFKLLDEKSDQKLAISERAILDALFEPDRLNKEIRLSQLRNDFYLKFQTIKKQTETELLSKNWLDLAGRKFQTAYFILGPLLVVGSFFVSLAFIILGISLFIIGLTLFIFAFIMPKRPIEGWRLYQRIRGFKLYMETAEKYRQRFNEKENIFEKLLPYAIMFGITKKWLNAFKNIYGEKYFTAYHPYWFYTASGASFNFDSLNSAISGISSSIGTATGAGGAGSSGGGGGGGGGGGW